MLNDYISSLINKPDNERNMLNNFCTSCSQQMVKVRILIVPIPLIMNMSMSFPIVVMPADDVQ